MHNPTIFPFGIRIDEPITSLTDVLVAAVCFYAWLRLRKMGNDKPEMGYFKWFFLLMSVATFLGGVVGHAFLYALSFEWKLPAWLVSMLSITLVERAVIVHSRSLLKPGVVRFFYWFNILELLTFASLAFGFLEFRYVEIHSAYGLMVVVLGFCIFNYRNGRKTRAIKLFIAGVGISILAAAIFTARLSISQWFNYIDISHVLMAVTAWCFYLGAKDIALREGSAFSKDY